MWDKDTYNFMEFVRGKCEMVQETERVWAEMPEGSLVVHKRADGNQLYWQKWTGDKCKQVYLSPKKDFDLIDKLRKKKNFQPEIKKAHQWKKMLSGLKPIVKQILDSYEPASLMDSKIHYSEKPDYLDGLQTKTLRGELVRSMSEALIANKLFYMKIPYRYEKQLLICGEYFYPDFTVTNPLNGEEFYIEYLGLDTEEYLHKWNKKLSRYHQAGIFENEKLIIITKKQHNSIDLLFCKLFTLERYSVVLTTMKIA